MIENKAIRNILIGILIVFFFVSVFFLGTTPVGEDSDEREIGVSEEDMGEALSTLEVHYIDVGKGDCIFIKCGSETMLIDAGEIGKSMVVTDYLRNQDVTKLDYVIGTHFDTDHIGGLEHVLQRLDCGKLIMPDQKRDTKTYAALMQIIEHEGYEITHPGAGESFMLGSAVCTILAPLGTDYEEKNDYSIVLRIDHGSNSFLFTGDAEKISEKEMLKAYGRGDQDADGDPLSGSGTACGLLSADVLKIAHHGGKNSTGKSFLDAVDPTYAVISCGKDDPDHPEQKILKRLFERGVKLYRTDIQGTVVCYSNGLKLIWNAEPIKY